MDNDAASGGGGPSPLPMFVRFFRFVVAPPPTAAGGINSNRFGLRWAVRFSALVYLVTAVAALLAWLQHEASVDLSASSQSAAERYRAHHEAVAHGAANYRGQISVGVSDHHQVVFQHSVATMVLTWTETPHLVLSLVLTLALPLLRRALQLWQYGAAGRHRDDEVPSCAAGGALPTVVVATGSPPIPGNPATPAAVSIMGLDSGNHLLGPSLAAALERILVPRAVRPRHLLAAGSLLAGAGLFATLGADVFFALVTYAAVGHNVVQHAAWLTATTAVEPVPWLSDQTPLAAVSGPREPVRRWFRVSICAALCFACTPWLMDDERGLDWFHWDTPHAVLLPPWCAPLGIVGTVLSLLVALSTGGTLTWWATSGGPSVAHAASVEMGRGHRVKHVVAFVGCLAVVWLTWLAGVLLNHEDAPTVLLAVPHSLLSLFLSLWALVEYLARKDSGVPHEMHAPAVVGLLAVVYGLSLLEHVLVDAYVTEPTEWTCFLLYAAPQILHMVYDPTLALIHAVATAAA